MWATVYPSFGSPVYSLQGPRTSAVHFGKCGLHQGQGENKVCIDSGMVNIQIEEHDKVPNIGSDWEVRIYKNQPGYNAGFKGWGGWGQQRPPPMFEFCPHVSLHRGIGTTSTV